MTKTTISELNHQIFLLEAQVEVLTEILRERGLRATPTVHPATFTPKQHAVIQMIHEGWDTNEMAEKMMTSTATIKGHISSVMNYLGVRRRDALIDLTTEMLKGDPQEYKRHARIPINWSRLGAPPLPIVTKRRR
jgi:DNA-binding NarL/FixJ family response regulator